MIEVEPGCYIDNSAGIYTPLEVCERLVDIGREVGAKLGRWPIGKLPTTPYDKYDPDTAQYLYETEIELEEKINAAFMEQDQDRMLMLYDGAYCIVLRSEWEDE